MQAMDEGGFTASLEEVEMIASAVLRRLGFSNALAEAIADRLAAAERDGPASHGLAMLPLYSAAAKSGTVNLDPQPGWQLTRPGFIVVDCDNSFAPLALNSARPAFIDAVVKQGCVVLATRHAHHIGALRHDVEPLAEAGLIAMMFAGSRPWVVPHGGTRSLFGTNPMAFACPRADAPPLVWDQAVSISAISDIRLAQKNGEDLPRPMGLNSTGEPSSDPAELIEAQRLFTYGEHKGTTIALMIELLAAGLSGGQFAIEHSTATPDNPTNPSGQTLIAIDPGAVGDSFLQRIALLFDALEDNGSARIPGDGRLARAATAERDGVLIASWLVAQLTDLGYDIEP